MPCDAVYEKGRTTTLGRQSRPLWKRLFHSYTTARGVIAESLRRVLNFAKTVELVQKSLLFGATE